MHPRLKYRRGLEGGDPFWSSVVLLAINETGKADGNTAFDDQSNSNHTISIEIGTPQWDTAQSVNGTMAASCLFDGVDDGLSVATHADFTPGTNDFTIEWYVRFAAVTGAPLTVSFSAADPDLAPSIYMGGAPVMAFYVSSANQIVGTTTIATDTWYHMAWSRVSGTSRLFLNGVQEGSNYSDSNNYGQRKVWIGIGWNSSNDLSGWLSNIRMTSAGRYSGTFTPPVPPFPQN